MDLSLVARSKRMYLVWFLISAACFVGYLLIERKIAGAMHKSIATQQPARLSGKKSHYLAGISVLSFASATALYLGFVALYEAPVISVCLLTGLIVAAVTSYVASSRLQYVAFDTDEK